MSAARRITVGWVQIGASFSGQCYLPYSVGVLQSYVQRNLAAHARYDFLPAVCSRVPVDEALAALEGADLVGFSVYVWNEQLSLAIARALKAKSPHVVVVFGGPQVPRDAADYLREHRCVDLTVQGEGERAFEAVLDNFEARAWDNVPSANFLRADGTAVQTELAPRIKDLGEVPSPYLTGVFDTLMQSRPQTRWIATWETNRGCPFKCTFCDFGSATASKVHSRSMEHVCAELEWVADRQIEYVFCADANFGMFPRDEEIARACADIRRRTGYPKVLSVESAKNVSSRAFTVQKILQDAGLSKGAVIAAQSLHPPTLDAIQRSNISMEAYHQVHQQCLEAGMATMTDLILGLPKETYNSFVDGIVSLMDRGQHHKIQFNNLCILPNAEMGDAEYRRAHGMQLVPSHVVNQHGDLQKDAHPEIQQLCVATESMPVEDWVAARAFCWMVAFLHFDKVLQLPLVLVRNQSGVGYRRLLERFSKGSPGTREPVLDGIRQRFLDVARGILSGGAEYCPSTAWLNIWWPPNEFTLIDLVTRGQLDAFYDEAQRALEDVLAAEGTVLPAGLLDDAMALSRAMLKQPDQNADADVTVRWNVMEYFNACRAGAPAPLLKQATTYRVLLGDERWTSDADWMRRVVWYQNKTGQYWRAVQVLPPSTQAEAAP